MKKESKLNLEEVVCNAKQSDYLELPLSKKAFFLVAALSLAAVLVVFFQLFALNILKKEDYQARAQDNVNDEFYFPAPRGIIFDRFGKELVKNIDASGIFLNLRELFKKPKEINGVITKLSGILNIDAAELKNSIKNTDLEKNRYLKIALDIPLDQIKELLKLGLSYVEIKKDSVREYFDGPVFAHILGYTGTSSGPEAEGKTGLEASYNEFLKGGSGKHIVYKNAKGKVLDEKTVSYPKAGYRLDTTIDAEFQNYFYKTLAERLRFLGRTAGVGIALNPQNGEILALVSLPSFNNNYFSASGFDREKTALLNSSSKPFFNRAISGLYAPGSTIKPLVALAALKEKIIDVAFKVYSAGYVDIPNPYDPEKPSRFLDWQPHGWVDLYGAIARSSNVYFYALSGGLPSDVLPRETLGGKNNIAGLGIEKLNEYWHRFGLGKKTGIDLPAEADGFLPHPLEKEKRKNDIWRLGDTYNVSIGQGDILVTPIQLLNYIGSIGNSGKVYRPFIVKNVKDEKGEVVLENKPQELFNYSDWTSEIREVQKGMKDAVKMFYGTASLLSDLPIEVAAKTGTAQVFNNQKNNAFFVGYLPTEALAKAGASIDKQIAILVLVEDVPPNSGLNAVPIAKEIMEWYYYNRIRN